MTTMTDHNKTGQSQDSRRQRSDLDARYGKIGISAVAAALDAIAERPAETESQHTPYERD